MRDKPALAANALRSFIAGDGSLDDHAGALILVEMAYDMKRLRVVAEQLAGAKKVKTHWL